MKVMKFCGTSVGSVNSILSVKKIVESAGEPVIVVVLSLIHIYGDAGELELVAVSRQHDGFPLSGEEESVVLHINLCRDEVAVSYTHLDVYKRQL